jgi:prefoldin beta subunit
VCLISDDPHTITNCTNHHPILCCKHQTLIITLRAYTHEQKELKLACEDQAESAVYKLVGQVLIKQEHAEARQNVEKRLEYITGEM